MCQSVSLDIIDSWICGFVEYIFSFFHIFQASLIVSGGEGFINLNNPDALPQEQSTLIMWQQNTT